MSRKWTETKKPCRCVDCSGYCPENVCITENHPIRDPQEWRFCDSYSKKVKERQ